MASHKGKLQILVLLSLTFLLPVTVLAYSYPVDEIKLFEDIEKIANLKEDEIDIGWVALIFAKERDSNLDIDKYNTMLNIIARDIDWKASQKGNDPDYRVRVMNTYFFKMIGFQFDKGDPYAEKPSNRTIDGAIDTKKGGCWTLPLLYLAVAQRLG